VSRRVPLPSSSTECFDFAKVSQKKPELAVLCVPSRLPPAHNSGDRKGAIVIAMMRLPPLVALFLLSSAVVARGQCPSEDEFYPNGISLPATVSVSPGSDVVVNGLVQCAANTNGDWFKFNWTDATPETMVDIAVEFSSDSFDAEVFSVEYPSSGGQTQLSTSDHPSFGRERVMIPVEAGKTYGRWCLLRPCVRGSWVQRECAYGLQCADRPARGLLQRRAPRPCRHLKTAE
jgi:hypothetical protein